MSRKPLDRGRVAFVAETYQSNELGANGQPKTKNRYANLGRATLWPSDDGGQPVTQIELDAVPMGHTGPLRLYVFWDSQNQQNQGGQGGYGGDPGYGGDSYNQGQQPAQGGYQGQQPAPGGYGQQRR